MKELGPRSVRLGLDSEGRRHLFVPTDEAPPHLPGDGEAVRFSIRHLAFGTDSGLVLDVECVDASVHAEFDLLVEDVVSGVDSVKSAGPAALEAVDRWRRLLALQRTKRLSFTEQMGLLAELTVLDRALSTDRTVVETWRGPFREPHDFEFSNGCVEVKAVSDATSIEVHGLRQLTSHDGRPLYLLLVEVFAADDGATVLETATRLREVHGVDLDKPFSALGLSTGVEDNALARFGTGSVVVIDPKDTAPRLLPSTGAAEDDFSEVAYRLRIAALLPFASALGLDELLQEVLNA
ncbi:PD-(D/E)XK motif protein [Rathayibacter oskolensis]|uniref:PD-(D/E)XK motif protein n=1 Tax=Rathayibacter oskolensis TaxID=1891671 RepID=UPI00265E54F8|nr:PD-(D/E)XK motif protein [Rathayibacter oskolensis]WKK70543.1 PD-(D/E)XK motif protein [Rathayibacter oskolensis]